MGNKTTILLKILGNRLKQARLNANYTQKEVAEITGMSRTAVEGAENGKCTLSTFVNILIALGIEDQLDTFLPEAPASPVQLARASGNKRKRASAAKNRIPDSKSTKGDLGW